MARKEAEQTPVRLVRLAQVIAEAGDGNERSWYSEAEQIAETMPGLVTCDWAGKPCVSWVDAERLYLRMIRDRDQLNREQSERLVELERASRGHVPGVTHDDSAAPAPMGVY